MIRDRILKYIAYRGISRYRFYKMTGLSNGFLDKEGAINSDNCEKICAIFPDMDPEWLLLGNGNMLRSSGASTSKKGSAQEHLPLQDSSVEILLNKIVELTSENTLLKKENEGLRHSGVKPYSEEGPATLLLASEPEP